MPLLTDFRATLPRNEGDQSRALEWLIAAHTEAEAASHGLDATARGAFARRIGAALSKCGCPPTKIARRRVAITDLGSEAWDEHVIYDLREHPRGRGSAARTLYYADHVERYFADAYADDAVAPDDLVHVTCTGYISPSGAQQLVARRGWNTTTRVTHAYHMGCYAALPSVRIAAGYLASISRRVDLVHTELCSLHFDPSDHRLEQLVVQSLFADGLIRYTAVADHGQSGLRLRALHEQLIPDSAHAMGWMVSDHGMQMTLSRDVPARVTAELRGFVGELFARAGIAPSREHVYAIHPGGPRIIDGVRDVLELDEAQVRTSRDVLFDHGNMSSATLPHIWMRLLADPDLPRGTLIPSLAFGPGLTISGGVFEKR
jgi:predicted naringenin-chalcone synthase